MFDVVKKLSMVVTPSITLAGSAFHSIQNVTKEEVTKIRPKCWHINGACILPFTWYKDSCVIKPFISGKVKSHLQTAVVS